jgi:hypothetical protein
MLMTVLMGSICHGQSAPAGPRIVLEEEEITLMENGKEVKKSYVSKKERDAILKEIKEKVLKKLGVTSEGEAIEQKLGQAFDEEIKKLIRVKQLDQPKMKFVDANDNVIKEIDIKTGIQREVRRSHPKLKKPHLMEEYIARYVAMSSDGQYALFSESLSEGIVPETEQEKKSMMDTDAGDLGTTTAVRYYDVKGNILWERQTPPDMRVNKALISNDGKVVAYIQDFIGTGNRKETEPPTKLVVVDKGGREIIIFPVSHGENVLRANPDMAMSPSGRYLSVQGRKGIERANFFVDVKNKTMWVSDEHYYVRNIEDSGQAEVLYMDVKKTDRKVINLKQHLGD